MQKKQSLLGNTIIFDETSREKSITDILSVRFSESDFLENSLDDLYDPYLLQDMDKAVVRIKEAKEKNEKVIIFWDYDVDGVTSTSLLMHLFTKLWIATSYRLPHRVKDGYGLKKYFIDELVELWVDLVVTVDCGSRDRDIVTYAKEKWLDIIVTDHHHVPPDMPEDAIAFINPNRPDCNYPDKNLAGAGVAFKIVMALAREYYTPSKAREYIQQSCDIAAIGTVADCMQLVGENRIIVTQWLIQIKKSRSLGIRKLIEDKIHEDIDGDLFGFLIGPRLNAAGRMDTPYKAVNLILNNEKSVYDTLREIEELNNLRKEKTRLHTEAALGKVSSEDNLIFYDAADIEHGIIGIVAGRLTEKFHKPSIVLIDEGDKLVASCRAPEYFSMIDLLDEHKDLFIAYGGHKQAAGLSISKENFPKFKSSVLKKLNAQDFSQYTKEIEVDKIVSLDEIGFSLIREQNKFKPFGMGNTKPLYMIQDFTPEKISFLWKGREHIRFEHRYGFKIFAFFMWEYYEELKKNKNPIQIVVDIAEDNFNGQCGIMLKVVDIVL